MNTPDTHPTVAEVLAIAFKGHGKELAEAYKAFGEGATAAAVSKNIIEPIINDIETNMGQEMIPLYVSYMVQLASTAPDTTLANGKEKYEKAVDSIAKFNEMLPTLEFHEEFQDFVINNIDRMLPVLIEIASSTPLTFDKKLQIRLNGIANPIPMPDITAPYDDNVIVIDRADHWISSLMKSISRAYATLRDTMDGNPQEDAEEAPLPEDPAQ